MVESDVDNQLQMIGAPLISRSCLNSVFYSFVECVCVVTDRRQKDSSELFGRDDDATIYSVDKGSVPVTESGRCRGFVFPTADSLLESWVSVTQE